MRVSTTGSSTLVGAELVSAVVLTLTQIRMEMDAGTKGTVWLIPGLGEDQQLKLGLSSGQELP